MSIEILKTEIDTDPLARGYSGMTNQQLVDSLNAVDRPNTVSIEEILKFLLLDNTHQTDGNDTQDRSIWIRMRDVDALAVTPTSAISNPWVSSVIGTVTDIQQIKTKQLLEFFTLSAQGDLPVDLTDSNFIEYLAGAQAAGCMSKSQETALKALGDNLQSRGTEIGYGKVKLGHIQEAKA